VLRSSSVTLAPGARLRARVNGPIAGSDYDQLDVTGAVTLTGASLVVTAGFNPGTGLSFTLINNDGADAVVGTFNNLPAGALLTNGAVVFEIDYTGGDGNDVVLTRVIAAPPSTIQPLGLSNGVRVIAGLGLPNVSYVLEATTTLNTPIPWQPILTNTTDGAGVYQFLDFDGTNFPMRFYRVLSP
jgi:fibronectin-binding autotransporter adhesin